MVSPAEELFGIYWLFDGRKWPFREALETVFPPVTIGHIMTGKVYTRAVRCHMMPASYLWLLLLGEFWHSLTAVEQAQIVKIYDSPNPEERKD